VLSHHVIYDRIWGYDFGPESKNLAVFIGYLRRKLDLPGDALIHSVRGVGYVLPGGLTCGCRPGSRCSSGWS
jgi:two-component system response regulator MprA